MVAKETAGKYSLVLTCLLVVFAHESCSALVELPNERIYDNITADTGVMWGSRVKRAEEKKINCYFCSHNEHAGSPGCLDPIDKSYIHSIACDTATHYCSKSIRSKPKFMVSRGCLKTCTPKESESVTTTCCNTDLCNSAHALHKTWLGMLPSTLFLVKHVAMQLLY